MLFDYLMKFQIRYLLKKIKQKIDIVWCFEPNLYSDLSLFNSKLCIYHPVDEIIYDYQINVAKNADIVFSVSNSILSKLSHIPKPSYYISHGLSDLFIERDTESIKLIKNSHGKIKIGYVGNLLISSLDRNCLKFVIANSPDYEFYFWGPSKLSESNLAGEDSLESNNWINWLNERENVKLKGVIPKSNLAKEIQVIDVFLICLDLEKDKNKGSNSHKILEYLSTGKVIVSKPIMEYLDTNNLIEMTNDNSSNAYLDLFNNVTQNIESFNSNKLQELRIKYAKDNTYHSQITKIVTHLNNLKS
jgi:hypothetical protein